MSGGDHYLRAAREEAVGAVCITPIFTTTLTAALSSNTVATATAVATTVSATTAATATDAMDHGGGSNRSRGNTAVAANGTSSPTVIAAAPAAPPTPGTPPPTPVTSEAAPTPYVIESPLLDIGFLFLAGFATPGPLKFTMTSDCGASSHLVDSNLIGDIESWMKDIVKLDPPATIFVAGRSTLRGVSMGTLTVRVIDAQGFLHDMLLPAMNVPGLSRHLFSGGTAVLKEIKTVIDKESYLDVGQFKISLREDTECSTTDYLDVELTPRGNYRTEAAFPTRVISGHTIPTGSALASQLLRSGAIGAVHPLATAVRPLIATSTAAPGLPRDRLQLQLIARA